MTSSPQSRQLATSHLNAVWLLVRSVGVGTRTAAVLLIVVVAGAIVAGNYVALHLRTDYRDALALGGNVLVLSNDETGVSARQCDNLVVRDDVLAAGWVRPGDVLRTTAAPGVAVTTASASIGAIRVITGDLQLAQPSPGMIVSSGAATDLGASRGSLLTWGDLGQQRVSAVVDTLARYPTSERWIFTLEASSGVAQECWLEVAEGRRSEVEASVRAAFTSGASLSIRALTTSPPEATLDAAAIGLYRALPVIGVVAGAILVALMRLFERSTPAILDLCGARRSVRVYFSAALLGAISAGALGVGAVVALVASAVLSLGSETTGWRLGALILASNTVAVAIASAVRSADSLTILKDR